MELTLEILTGESCKFQVLDTTTGESGYLSDSSEVVKDRFKFTDTIKIYALQINKIDNSYLEYSSIQWLSENKYVDIPTKFDGWFTLNYLVLPTKEYVETNKEELKELYTTIYCSDGIHLYKLQEDQFVEVNLVEVIEVNPNNTTISKYTEDLVSICHLKECYIDICKQIFELRGFSKCLVNGSVDSQLIYNRDLIWMTINIVSYLVEFGEFTEAERIIELFGGCNNVCKSKYSTTNSNNCGCSQV